MTIFPLRLWSDLNCVCMCVVSGSVEQSWAERSIASSIIHQSHKWYRLNREWQGCSACPLSASLSVFSARSLSLCHKKQFPFENNHHLSKEKRSKHTVSCFIKVHISIFWQHKSRKYFSGLILTASFGKTLKINPARGQYLKNRHVGQGWPEHPQWPTDQVCGNPATAEKILYKNVHAHTNVFSHIHTHKHTPA